MKGLYDIHCHILPGVDDGARNMEESLWMLNKEYQEGVRHVILTPHFRYDMFEPHMNIVTRQFMQLRRAAMNIGDEGMRLYLGCELHSSMDMVECLKKGRRLTLAGSRYVLVEFSNGDEKNYIEERVRSLLMNGFIPIIAHVERYQCLHKQKARLEEFQEQGVLFQVNYNSIKKNKWLFQQGFVDLLSTDCHNEEERAPKIQENLKDLNTCCDRTQIERILRETPDLIWNSGKEKER